MSNSDSFFNEVTEDLRRERALALLRRYGWIAVVLVLLVVGGTAWNEWRKAQASAKAEAFGDAVLTALENNETADRISALGQIEATGAQAGLLQLLRAGALLEQDRAAALVALQAAADDTALPDAYRQLATLKRIIAGGSDISLAEREALLSRLSQPGQPMRPLALEQTALLQLEQGNRETAIEILTDLLAQSEVSDTLRRRATQLLTALGGSVE
ncbi:MAG: hypothetical protein EA339_08700 [Rhodobacteraceae bacterium]|nr:MAG: hypothetical protein EA339_08700 [Paracoccaceae bacterium]